MSENRNSSCEEAGVSHVAAARVSVSFDSPEKIHNFDSPTKPVLSKEAVGSIVATFRRGLVL